MDEPLLKPRDNPSQSGYGTVRGRQRQTGPLVVLIGGEYNQEDYNDFQANETSSFQITTDNDSGKGSHSRQKDDLRQALVYGQVVWPVFGTLMLNGHLVEVYMFGNGLMFTANMLLIATTDRLLIITDILPTVLWGFLLILFGSNADVLSGLFLVFLFVCACFVVVRLKNGLWSVDNFVSITLQKFNVNLKQLQEEHEEKRLIMEQENAQKLRIQQEKLAYLESSPIAKTSMVPLFIFAAAALWSMGSVFYFRGWISSIQVEQIEWKPR